MKKETGRDEVDTFLIWTMILCGATLMALVSVISPLAYLWTMGLVGIVVTMAVTMMAIGSVMGDGGIFSGFFIIEIAKVGAEIVGAILCGILDASK